MIGVTGGEGDVTLEEAVGADGVCHTYVCAVNQGGYDGTAINLPQLIQWIKANRPDLLS